MSEGSASHPSTGRRYLYAVARLAVWTVMRMFFPLRVEGRENVPERGPFILASNHTSFLDPPFIGCACPRRLRYAARDTLFRNGLFALLIGSLGALPVDPDGRGVSLRRCVRALGEGDGLLLFPEGTRSHDGSLRFPRPGIGFLACRSACPVVPMRISGTHRAFPPGSRRIRPSRIFVVFGKPFVPSGHDYRAVAEEIMRRIADLPRMPASRGKRSELS